MIFNLYIKISLCFVFKLVSANEIFNNPVFYPKFAHYVNLFTCQ